MRRSDTRFRSRHVAGGAVLLYLLAVNGIAQTGIDETGLRLSVGDGHATLDADQVPLGRLLTALDEVAGTESVVPEELSPLLLTIHLEDRPFPGIAGDVLKELGLDFAIAGRRVIVLLPADTDRPALALRWADEARGIRTASDPARTPDGAEPSPGEAETAAPAYLTVTPGPGGPGPRFGRLQGGEGNGPGGLSGSPSQPFSGRPSPASPTPDGVSATGPVPPGGPAGATSGVPLGTSTTGPPLPPGVTPVPLPDVLPAPLPGTGPDADRPEQPFPGDPQ